MQVAVVGTGYVGLVTGVILSELGNSIICIDIDPKKVEMINQGKSPIYEPGLIDILKRNLLEKRFIATLDFDHAMETSDIIFIAVGTPSAEDGSVDISQVVTAATNIGKSLAKLSKKQRGFKVIVDKSTVPVGTGDLVKKTITKYYSGPFGVVSNPEFLREGNAVYDALHPDRIVLGKGNSKIAETMMRNLYQSFDCPILVTDVKTAELIKYASNAFLATSISFANQIAQLSEIVGTNIVDVAEGMKLDKRIGKQAFLSAGIGYGGSCFPKDVKGLINMAKNYKVEVPILTAAEDINYQMRQIMIAKIKKLVPSLKGKTVAIWGLAFKPQTDDIREAPALTIIDWLIKQKCNIVCFDPVASQNVSVRYPKLKFSQTPYEAIKKADLLLLMTEWDEFRDIDLKKVKRLMKKPIMIDGRNVYANKNMEKMGFVYRGIGQCSRSQ